jgi:hypothetical protein
MQITHSEAQTPGGKVPTLQEPQQVQERHTQRQWPEDPGTGNIPASPQHMHTHNTRNFMGTSYFRFSTFFYHFF